MATALVIRVSAGPGAKFAYALARERHDLILTACRVDRLEALAGDLRRTHGVAANIFAADLAKADAPADVEPRRIDTSVG